MDLQALHATRTHPIPPVRERFLDHRVLSLAGNQRERKAHRQGLDASQQAFLVAIESGAIPARVVAPHLDDDQPVEDSLNSLVQELEVPSATRRRSRANPNPAP